MSFMSGFADAFGRQMEIGENHRAQQKQDAFRIAYDSYLRKQNQYDEDQKKDKSFIDSAQGMMKMLPNAPEGAWVHAYQMLKAGTSFEKALERMQSMQFAATTTPSMPENDVDSQMENSGLMRANNPAQTGAVDPMQAQAAPSANPDLIGNEQGPMGMFDSLRQQGEQRRMDNARNSVMSAAGLDQEQFDKINSGYVSPVDPTLAPPIDMSNPTGFDVSGAKASETFVGFLAGGGQTPVMRGPDGWYDVNSGKRVPDSMLTNALTPAMAGDYTQRIDKIDAAMKPVAEKRASIAGAAADFFAMNEIAKNNPEAIARISALPNFANEAANEIKGLQSLFASGDLDAIAAKEQEVTNFLLEKLSDAGMDATARDAQLFASAKTSLVFKLARLQQETGTISNADFDNVAASLLSTNDPDIFNANAKAIIARLMDQNDREVGTFKNTPGTQAAKKLYDIDAEFMPWEELLGDKVSDWLADEDAPQSDVTKSQENKTTTQDNKVDESLPTLTAAQAKALGDESLVGKKYKKQGSEIYVEGIDF